MVFIAQDSSLEIEKIETSPFGTNAYIITCRKTNQSILVDAPSEAERIIESLKRTVPKYIVITHNHMDHIDALPHIVSELKLPVGAHKEDAGGLPRTPKILLDDGDAISVGEIDLKIIHTPGHTPGSICLHTGKYLISGDTVFPGGPGKTHSPEALKQIIDSITNKLFILPDDTEVYPGHGTPTILGDEKKAFAVFSSRTHPSNLCGDVLWISS